MLAPKNNDASLAENRSKLGSEYQTVWKSALMLNRLSSGPFRGADGVPVSTEGAGGAAMLAGIGVTGLTDGAGVEGAPALPAWAAPCSGVEGAAAVPAGAASGAGVEGGAAVPAGAAAGSALADEANVASTTTHVAR